MVRLEFECMNYLFHQNIILSYFELFVKTPSAIPFFLPLTSNFIFIYDYDFVIFCQKASSNSTETTWAVQRSNKLYLRNTLATAGKLSLIWEDPTKSEGAVNISSFDVEIHELVSLKSLSAIAASSSLVRFCVCYVNIACQIFLICFSLSFFLQIFAVRNIKRPYFHPATRSLI